MAVAQYHRTPLHHLSQNPWYVLMTVTGEQFGDYADADLHSRNRRLWNGWMMDALVSDADREHVLTQLPPDETPPLGEDERGLVRHAIETRAGGAWPDAALPVDLGNSVHNARLCLSGYLFPAGLSLRNTVLCGDLLLNDALILADFDLSGAHLVQQVDADRLHVAGEVNATVTRFADRSSWDHARIGGCAVFHGAVFGHDAILTSIRFDDIFEAQAAVFEGEADFSGCHFAGPVYANPVMFLNTASFYGTRFLADASLRGSYFRQPAEFRKMRAAHGIDLEHATFDEPPKRNYVPAGPKR